MQLCVTIRVCPNDMSCPNDTVCICIISLSFMPIGSFGYAALGNDHTSNYAKTLYMALGPTRALLPCMLASKTAATKMRKLSRSPRTTTGLPSLAPLASFLARFRASWYETTPLAPPSALQSFLRSAQTSFVAKSRRFAPTRPPTSHRSATNHPQERPKP